MGLTIHYNLQTDGIKPTDVRRLVETMRRFALDLPFKEVGDVKEFTGEETDFQNASTGERWLKVQARGIVETGDYLYHVVPHHIIAFSTWPGEGCEAANFGFCKYPALVPPHATSGRKELVPTNLRGWRWSSFCKTQYASDPRYGGVEHFLRCHLSVVKMLDFIKATGLVKVEVKDEGGYWEGRDLEKLAKEVGDWNAKIAGIVSLFRSTTEGKGQTFEAPITGFPNFEHLEAKGLEKLADLRQAFGKDREE